MNTLVKNLAGILLLLVILFFASCSEKKAEQESKKETPISVQIGTPSQQLIDKITVSGQIESQEIAVISTRVMGFVSNIKVRPGDKVEKGQLLASISNEDLLAKRAQAQAMISEAEVSLKDAQKDYERFDELHKQQSASTKELENVTLRYNSVKAKVETAQQMKNEAEAMLAYTNLVAPFSGVITQKHIDEGSMANPGMPILTIEHPNGYHARAYVLENEVGKLKVGMPAIVTIKSTGKKINGRVSEISPSSHSTGGHFYFKVTLPNKSDIDLFSGMYANVSVPLKNDSGTKGLFVPASAIVRKDQLAGLYTVSEDQTAQLRWLKLGKEYGDEIEILSGLTANEKFIVQGDGKLYSGVPVLVK